MTDPLKPPIPVGYDEDYDTLAGVDVNDFTSVTTWGIFNDPLVWDPKFATNGGSIPDTMREVILETPIYTDEDGERALRHALLTNEDRKSKQTLTRDGMVIIKRQVTLTSPWVLDEEANTGDWVVDSTASVELDLRNLGTVGPS